MFRLGVYTVLGIMSVLVPPLFSIYINDLLNQINSISKYMQMTRFCFYQFMIKILLGIN